MIIDSEDPMYLNNIIPDGEGELHIPYEDCPCKPNVKNKKGYIYLFHKSKDHREIVYGVEIMLGYRCKEHGHLIEYGTHNHINRSERWYEYKHPKQ